MVPWADGLFPSPAEGRKIGHVEVALPMWMRELPGFFGWYQMVMALIGGEYRPQSKRTFFFRDED